MEHYTFAHKGPVYIVRNHCFEIAYYSHLGKKYRRIRDIDFDTWEETKAVEVDNDTFWMVVACVERIK